MIGGGGRERERGVKKRKTLRGKMIILLVLADVFDMCVLRGTLWW